MDDDLQRLEAELRRLRPLAPSEELRGTVEKLLASSRRARARRRVVFFWWALPVAAAIALAAMMLRESSQAGSSEAAEASGDGAAVFRPVAADKVLLAARDEGYVTFADGTPARRVRTTYLDTITWQNPRTRASLTWTVPREEVRVVPVSFQ